MEDIVGKMGVVLGIRIDDWKKEDGLEALELGLGASITWETRHSILSSVPGARAYLNATCWKKGRQVTSVVNHSCHVSPMRNLGCLMWMRSGLIEPCSTEETVDSRTLDLSSVDHEASC